MSKIGSDAADTHLSLSLHLSIVVLFPAGLMLAAHERDFEGLDGHSMRVRRLV